MPDKTTFNTVYPELYLADMNVFGKSYLQQTTQGEVHLQARERFVNFTASARQFTGANTVRFQYKLEGLEDDG